MKINREKLSEMIKLSDKELWQKIQELSKKYGFTIPEKAPPHSDLEKIRSTLSGGKLNAKDALRLMNELRRTNGRG